MISSITPKPATTIAVPPITQKPIQNRLLFALVSVVLVQVQRLSNALNSKSMSASTHTTHLSKLSQPPETPMEQLESALTTKASSPLSNAAVKKTINATPGDGNCFFHAISEGLLGKPSTKKSQKAVRDLLINRLKQNDALATSLYGADRTEKSAYETALKELSQDGTWSDESNVSPSMLADILQVKLTIVDSANKDIYTITPNPHFSNGQSEAPHETPHIAMEFCGNHYNSITSKPLLSSQHPRDVILYSNNEGDFTYKVNLEETSTHIIDTLPVVSPARSQH